MLRSSILVSAFFTAAWCCPQHSNFQSHPHLGKRQTRVDTGREPKDWNYANSADWATIRPEYVTCQTGMTQSPINLEQRELATTHIPNFDGYRNEAIPGNFFNWEFAPAWTPQHPEGQVTGLPSFTFDDQQAFHVGWHIHAPSEHLVDGQRARAEIHFVHSNAADQEIAVIGMRVGVAPTGSGIESAFIRQLGPMISFNDTSQIQGLPVNLRLAIDEVGGVSQFWTYKGSLTTPPCSEGLRWFVPAQELMVSEGQMVEILAASRFSHRVEQQVWLHEVNR